MIFENSNNENILRVGNLAGVTQNISNQNSHQTNFQTHSNSSQNHSVANLNPLFENQIYRNVENSDSFLHGKNLLKQEKQYEQRRQIHPIDSKCDNHFDAVRDCPKWLNGEFCSKSKTKKHIKLSAPVKDEKVDQFIIRSINIPNYINKSNRNPFFECINIEPETDVWCFSELIIKKCDIPKIPRGYDLVLNESNEVIYDCLLVKKSESVKFEKVEETFNSTIIKIDIGPRKNDKFYIGSCYRSPSKPQGNKFYEQLQSNNDTEFREKFSSLLEKFKEKNFLLLGDMNWATNKKYWKNRTGEKQFSDWLFSTNFSNIFANSITYNPQDGRRCKPTSIDVGIKSFSMNLISYEIDSENFGTISDHNCCCVIIKKSQRKGKKTYEMVNKRVDPNDVKLRNRVEFFERIAIRKFRLNDAFKNFYYYDNKNNVCERILEAIEWIKEKSVEKVKIVKTDKKHVNKLSKEYYKLMKEKKRRYTFLVKNNKDVKGDQRLKRLKNLIQKEYRRSVRFGWKKKSEEKLAKNELEWRYIKRFNNEDVEIPKNLTPNDFASRFQDLSHDYTPIQKNPAKIVNKKTNFKFNYKIDIIGTDPSTNIRHLIKTCKNSKNSSGWDGVNLSFLRTLTSDFHKLIAYVVGSCLKSGCYLESFREVKAMPVFKKGNPKDVKNWRPIQIASWCCNLLEKIMCLQMTKFWEKKGLLGKNQYGFRANRSVGQLINEMRKEFIKRKAKYGMILLTDLSNAFGSCDSWLIIEKMRPYLCDRALKLLRSFLLQAEVRVKVGNKISTSFTSADRGYSQGSNLSTFLFIVLMSESHDLGKDNIGYSFADDMSILITSDNISELKNKGNEALERFHNFCKSTNIKLNCTKTFYTLLGSKYTSEEKRSIELSTDGEIIKQTEKMNVLGVELNKNIYFEDHFDHIARIVKHKIKNIIPFSHFSSLEFCSTLIKGFCHGKFRHALSYIPIQPSKEYNKINTPIFQFLRRKCATYNELKNESFLRLSQAVVFERSKITSLLNIHRLAGLQRLNKIFLTLEPKWELESCLKLMTKKTLEKWESNRTGIEFIKISQIEKSEQNTAPAIWVKEFNNLPKDLRNLIGTVKFEILCKKYFKSRCQHQENNNLQCKNCRQSTKRYEKNTTDWFPIWPSERREKNMDRLTKILIEKVNIGNKNERIRKSIEKLEMMDENDFNKNYWSKHV